jgi:glycosyltransferase involved in cell wall biosynthesis
MKILILSDRYHPAPVSGAVLVYDLALELSEQGHSVYVAAGDKNLESDSAISIENGINIFRIKTQDQKSLNKPARLLFELFLQRKIWKIFKEDIAIADFDLLIAHSPTIFWSHLIKKINKIKKIPTYLVLRDLFPQWTLDTGTLSKFNPVYWFLRHHEKDLYKNSDVLGVQSKGDLKYVSNLKNTLNFRTEVLYNWKRLNVENEKAKNLRSELSLQEKVIYIFGGNMGYGQDIDSLLRLVKSFKENSKIHFLFVGEGTEYKKIEEWIKIESSQIATLLPAVSDKDYQSILAECDVGIISLRKNFKTNNYPNKILNYMKYNLPILASINPGNEIEDLINQYRNGIVSSTGDDLTLSNNANILLESKIKRQEMGKRGQKLLKDKFDSKAAVKKILDSSVPAVKKHPNHPD